MQCACAILLSVACPVLPYSSTLSHKRHNFEKRKLFNIRCVLIFSTTLSETFLIPKRTQRYTTNVHSCPLKYGLFLSHFNGTCIFSTDFREKNSNTKFHGNPSSGSRVFPCRRTDGWTDMTVQILAFLNFSNALKHAASTNIICFTFLLPHIILST